MNTNLSRRRLLQGSACAAASLAFPSISNAQNGKSKLPNIVFIMADDLGYAHLGCYGQKKIHTPNIDRLADEGMKFSECYAGAPVCAPSRSVLMTGKHGGHTSVRANSGGVPLLDKDITVGEVLKQAGYTTGIFGKWGVGDIGTGGIPTKQGFDQFFGYLHQVHAHFYYPYYLWKNEEKYPLPGNFDGKRGQYTHDEIEKQALDFIRSNKDHPFFLYMPFTIPHTELLVPEDSFAEYDGQFEEPNPYTGKHYANQPKPRTAFAAMVTRMDRTVGRVMQELKKQGLDDNTIVFFTSDNGGQGSGGPDLDFFQGNRPLRGAKGMLYEGGIRVPMIARWPGRIAAGSESDLIWAFDDVLPTMAQIANVKPPNDIDGVSVLPTLIGDEAAGSPQTLRLYHFWEQGNQRRAARMGQWKAIRNGKDSPVELYDLQNDISESQNIAKAHPGILKRMEAILEEAHTPPRAYKKEPPTWGYKPEDTDYFNMD